MRDLDFPFFSIHSSSSSSTITPGGCNNIKQTASWWSPSSSTITPGGSNNIKQTAWWWSPSSSTITPGGSNNIKQTAWWWSALNNREEVSFLLCFEVWEEIKTRQGGAKGRRRRRSCKSESLSYCEFL